MALEFLNIPLFRDANYKQSIVLSGKLFFLLIMFNNVLGLWTLSFLDENENPIFTGRAIVLGAELLRGADSRLPKATLIAVDLTATHSEGDFDTLGESVKLMYVGTV